MTFVPEVVLALLLESFEFSPSDKHIYWSMTGISTPNTNPDSTTPTLPLLIKKVESWTLFGIDHVVIQDRLVVCHCFSVNDFYVMYTFQTFFSKFTGNNSEPSKPSDQMWWVSFQNKMPMSQLEWLARPGQAPDFRRQIALQQYFHHKNSPAWERSFCCGLSAFLRWKAVNSCLPSLDGWIWAESQEERAPYARKSLYYLRQVSLTLKFLTPGSGLLSTPVCKPGQSGCVSMSFPVQKLAWFIKLPPVN